MWVEFAMVFSSLPSGLTARDLTSTHRGPSPQSALYPIPSPPFPHHRHTHTPNSSHHLATLESMDLGKRSAWDPDKSLGSVGRKVEKGVVGEGLKQSLSKPRNQAGAPHAWSVRAVPASASLLFPSRATI